MRQMFTFLWKTRGNASPTGKPRVYFTCHPADFDRAFEKICTDIFASHDCAIYYTADMAAPIPDENRETDLGRMNLFVIPVTFCLLTQPNRAMDADFRFAIDKHIPVLPIMMESEIDTVYSRPDKFGSLQYLNPYSSDPTEIGYAAKLKSYLDAVLINDEMIARVRTAFDAYIFLSYRKKDRRLANELMRLIHSRPELRDIAVWYDEFLTPGESFQENIERILHDSKLCTLLVTPNLLEDPNYIMSTEYPAARQCGLPILPVEMPETIRTGGTDKAGLAEKYEGLTDCIPADEAYLQRLLELLTGYARSENDDDPAHNYLIGLAYIDGIDVERDTARGVTLITDAGKAGLPEAIQKLYEMYYHGISVRLDWHQARYWAEKLVAFCTETFGDESPQTLSATDCLAQINILLGAYSKALELLDRLYAIRSRTLGDFHSDTLSTLNSMAVAYYGIGKYDAALEIREKVYQQCLVTLGKSHPDTLRASSNLAVSYLSLCRYKKAVDLLQNGCEQCCEEYGELHPTTLTLRNILATALMDAGDCQKAHDMLQEIYAQRCEVLGRKHPAALTTRGNLALSYGRLGEYQTEIDIEQENYQDLCEVLGEEHPHTLMTLYNQALAYGRLRFFDKEAELEDKVYRLRCKVLGEEHPDTLKALMSLAVTLGDLKKHETAQEKMSDVYHLRSKVLGKEHPDTLTALHQLGLICAKCGDFDNAKKHAQDAYDLRCKALGKKHPDTLAALHDLAYCIGECGDLKKEVELETELFVLRRKVLGKTHPDTLNTLNNLATALDMLGEHGKALAAKILLAALARKAKP